MQIKKKDFVRCFPDAEVEEACLGLSGNHSSAFIEMAAPPVSSELELVRSDDHNPLLTTSYDTGKLIRCYRFEVACPTLRREQSAAGWRR